MGTGKDSVVSTKSQKLKCAVCSNCYIVSPSPHHAGDVSTDNLIFGLSQKQSIKLSRA